MARHPIDTVQLKLRFSEALRRRIEQAAKRSGHSMNAEIVARLKASFTEEDLSEAVARRVARQVTKHLSQLEWRGAPRERRAEKAGGAQET